MAETPTSPLEAALAYAEEFHAEDDILRAARLRGAEVGAPPILPGGGAALCFLATAVNARAVVEIGTGCGVSGLWLLRGM
ncbi:methyltransferase, partial [Micromonospora harpali]